MAAKLVLPILGGSPSVWNAAMMFFQTTLILGYLYSHVLTRRLSLIWQFIIHGIVLGCVVLALPIALPEKLISGLTPTTWLLATLSLIAGLPYFAAATTGPLLQHWFGTTDDPRAKDPYFLYAASNAGSFIGLLCFPFLIEPNFALNGQAEVWTVGYCLLVAAVLICGLAALRRQKPQAAPTEEAPLADAPRWSTRILWIGLAAAPSSLSLGVTAAITMDVAPVPLLWILPLSIYLLTFVLAFSGRFGVSSRAGGYLAMAGALCVAFNSIGAIRMPLYWVIGAHLMALTGCAYACHRRLYETRPDKSRLTEFYLWLAVGGALGGTFNAVVAPIIFTSFLEYLIALAACVALIAPTARAAKLGWAKHVLMAQAAAALVCLAAWLLTGPLVQWATVQSYTFVLCGLCVLSLLFIPGGNYRFAAALFAAVLFTDYSRQSQRGLIVQSRSFFGVYGVYNDGDRIRLTHGSTLHGEQFRQGELAQLPISYYHPKGPLGDIFSVLRSKDRPLRIAVVGLGAGSAAAYGLRGDRIVFFEIDPLVAAIAENKRFFTYIDQARSRGATVQIVIGDGRLSLGAMDEQFDLIILDAFSSDAIPVHMLTVEAIEVFKSKLAPDGLLAVHTTNRYFELGVIVFHGGLKADLGCMIRDDLARTPDAGARKASTWVVLSQSQPRLEALLARPEWFKPLPDPRQRVWTDSYSSLFDAPWR